MGGFHVVEDRPTPKEVYNWILYLEAATLATGSFLCVQSLKLQVHSLNANVMQIWL